MLEINIPGFKKLCLSHLVLDYNGTIAIDGKLINGVKERLDILADKLNIHVLTADTFGSVKKQLADIKCNLSIIPTENQELAKLNYIETLIPENTVCIGNGRNDRLMLKAAALGIIVHQTEGAAIDALTSADIMTPGIIEALDLLQQPLRLIATLRS